MTEQVVGESEGLEFADMIEILPHRYPFLLVDQVLRLNREENIVIAKKNVTFNEPFFQGHFPGMPIMPGVLILEALAQAGGLLFHRENKVSVLLNVNNAKFRRPVKPGDTLILQAEGIHFSSKGGRAKGRAMVDDKVVCQAEIGFAFMDKVEN